MPNPNSTSSPPFARCVATNGRGQVLYAGAISVSRRKRAGLRVYDLTATSEAQMLATEGRAVEWDLQLGSAVGLDLDVTYSDVQGQFQDLTSDATAIFTERAKQNGWRVDPTAPIRVHLKLNISDTPTPDISILASPRLATNRDGVGAAAEPNRGGIQTGNVSGGSASDRVPPGDFGAAASIDSKTAASQSNSSSSDRGADPNAGVGVSFKFFRRSPLASVIFAISLAISFGQDNDTAQGIRIWRDDTGKFEIEAQFEKIESGQVYLRKTDGTQVVVPLDRLSAADKQWILKRSGNSDKPATKPGDLVEVDVAQSIGWQLIPDPFLASPATIGDHYFGFDVSDDDYRTAEFQISRNGRWALINRLGRDKLVVANLCTEADTVISGGADDVVRISPSGRWLLTGAVNQLNVQPLDQGKLLAGKILRTDYRQQNGSGPVKLLFADFADDTVAITASNDGVLVAWDVVTGKAIWWISTSLDCVPAITPGGKYVVAHANDQLVAVEIATGRLAAKTPVANRGLRQLAVSPDGTLIGGAGNGVFRIWDFRSGQPQ